MNAQKHWESKSKRLQLVSGSNTCKTQSPQQQFVRLARKSLQSRDFELLSIPQYRKRNRHFITINFQKFSFSQGVFHVLERYIRFEPWDLFPLTIKCYRKCLQNYKGTIFGVAWTEKYRFEIINAVTDEPKGTIFSSYKLDNLHRITLLDRTISFFFLVSRLPQGKIKETFDFLSEIAWYSSFFKLVKDIWEKSMENNGDEIAVLFPEGHEAIQITY